MTADDGGSKASGPPERRCGGRLGPACPAQITGTRVNGDSLVTAIGIIQQLPETIVLQGTEGSHMWSLMIAEKSGTMTLTVGGNELGFVVFGACMPG